MDNKKSKPSWWLLNNSNGYPDFLFTILTWSMLLLVGIILSWLAFTILAYLNAGNDARSAVIIQIMDNMKGCIIALAGIIFGLAGSYTVRRFQRDKYVIEEKKIACKEQHSAQAPMFAADEVQPVLDEEDI